MKYLLLLLLTGVLVSDYKLAYAESYVSEDSLFKLSLRELLNIRVVTAATGIEQRVKDAPAAITVIESAEWQAMGARTLFEAINNSPGVHISKAQTALANNKPIIRGLSGTFGQQVLVMIDGMPLRRIRDGGSFIGQRIPLAGVKRIEIIRSPGSVVYGADAMGGVINMVTYEDEHMPSQATLRAGSFNSLDFEAATSFRIADHYFQLAFASQQADSDPNNVIEADLQTSLDQVFNTQASRAPGLFNDDYDILNFRGKWRWHWLDANAYVWHNNGSGTAAGISQSLDSDGWAKQRMEMYNINVDLSSWVSGKLKLKTTFRRVRTDVWFNVFPAGATLPVDVDGNINFINVDRQVNFPAGVLGTPGGDNRAQSVALEHVLHWQSHLFRWELGAEYNEVHAHESKNFGAGVLPPTATVVGEELTDVTNTPFIYLPDKTRRIRYFSVQDQWRFHPAWLATLGVRADHFSDFGSSINPRLGLTWDVRDNLILKAFSGSGFRAPNFVDLYSQNNPTGLGNPNLEAETIHTFESGLTGTFLASDQLQLDFSLFKYKNDNIIRYEPQRGVQVATNGGEQRGNGFEAQLDWHVSEIICLKANYSKLLSDTDEDTNISSVPGRMANLGLFVRPSYFNWFIGAKWVADRERSSDDSRPPIDDYLWINTRLESTWHNFTVGLTIDNLFDEDAREPSNGFVANDYPLHGRMGLVDIRYNF